VRNRTSAVLGGVAAVGVGALLLHWLHASATGYAPADPAYAVDPVPSTLPMVIGYVAASVTGVCLAAVGWWRPFLFALAVAYLTPALGDGLQPLLGDTPERTAASGMAIVEAALVAAPMWFVVERGRWAPRPLPASSRRALPRRDQPALPRPTRA